MNKFLLLITVSTFLIPTQFLWAQPQQPKGNIISQVRKIGEIFDGQDDLQKNLSRVNEMKIAEESQQLSTDQETMKTLNSYRNPFKPQLPAPEPITEKPNPEPVPQTQNIEQKPVLPQPQPRCALTGLVWNTSRPQAIINGKIMEIGEVIEGWTITQISKDGVELTYEDQKIIVARNVMPVGDGSQ